MSGSIKTLRALTIISFLNTIVTIFSPYVSFSNDSFALMLPFIFGAGCLIQFTALFFARREWKRINFSENNSRTFYKVILSISLAFAIVWIFISIASYYVVHALDHLGTFSFGHM